MVEIAKVAVKKAMKGDNQMIKLLLELFIAKPSPIEAADGQLNKITFNVRTLELGEPKADIMVPSGTFDHGDVIDITPEIIKEIE